MFCKLPVNHLEIILLNPSVHPTLSVHSDVVPRVCLFDLN